MASQPGQRAAMRSMRYQAAEKVLRARRALGIHFPTPDFCSFGHSKDFFRSLVSMRADAKTHSLLEHIPQELIVDFVVILHLLRLHERPQQPRAPVRRPSFQIGEAALHIRAK